MLELSNQDILDLPLDQLGIRILAELQGEWNWENFLALERQRNGRDEKALRALAEGIQWLFHSGLVAKDPRQSASAAIFITRLGYEILDKGPEKLGAVVRMQGDVHPLVQAKARSQFLLGEYENAVFTSMKEVEIRVRHLGGFGTGDIGVDLMNKAFGAKNGVLTDPAQEPGEQEATRAMFAGAYGLLRNPSGHREINFDDISEAAEMVHTASLLMRILDRVEARLANP